MAFVIRKPKFMRNDAEMMAHLDMARTLGESLSESNKSLGESWKTIERVVEHMHMAAEVGGFSSVEAMIKWHESH